MTITFPRSIPSEMVIEKASLEVVSVVGVSTSPFTGYQQVQEHQGQWWEGSVMVSPSERAEAAAISAWLTSLRGRSKTFLFGDPLAATPRGTASSSPGTPVVAGASQTGNLLNGSGAPFNQTGYLKAGDYIQLGSGSSSLLHMVLEDADTTAAGLFTLTLWPDLRGSPADTAAIVVSDAKGVFRLRDNRQSWDIQSIIYGFSFDFREVIG